MNHPTPSVNAGQEKTGLETGQTAHPPRSSRDKPVRQAVLNACASGAWDKAGGMPLVARSLYWVRKLGIEEVIILSSAGGAAEKLDKWRGKIGLREAIVPHPATPEAIPKAVLSLPGLDEWVLYIDCIHLVDPRLIQSLADARGSTLARLGRDDGQNDIIRAGLLNREDIGCWAEKGAPGLTQSARLLYPEDIDPFSPEIRGPLRPYFMEVRTASDAKEATRLLVCSQQKHVMDLPAEFIDPPFENALTIRLCDTPVTPNMVTAVGVCVAALVAWLFWNGHFVAGAFLTFAVEILDGVDGKLARTKLHYSKLGHHEDVIDYFCETSWYVSLGVGLSATAGGGLAAFFAALLVVSDTVDNVLYTFAGKWHGKSIDLFSPFDAAFRRIAGRRNIYNFMFIAGFSLGFANQTFAAVAVWAFITASIHWVRLFQFGRLKERLS
ncbi:MAG: CDP-alcohol phosphatidyltransferase family protein [Syntrophobacteraceae bacterium]